MDDLCPQTDRQTFSRYPNRKTGNPRQKLLEKLRDREIKKRKHDDLKFWKRDWQLRFLSKISFQKYLRDTKLIKQRKKCVEISSIFLVLEMWKGCEICFKFSARSVLSFKVQQNRRKCASCLFLSLPVDANWKVWNHGSLLVNRRHMNFVLSGTSFVLAHIIQTSA